MPHDSRLLPNFEHKKIGRKRRFICGLDFCALSLIFRKKDGQFFMRISSIQKGEQDRSYSEC